MVHLVVENRGYQNFTANPFKAMYVVVGGQSHNVSAAYLFLSNPFPPSIDLKNGENASGDVVFEVPSGSTSFTPEWRVSSGIRLDWVSS
jgi:hypothetical protein